MDSPALNAASRTVLIPLTRPQLPVTAVTVAGPGPIEPQTRSQLADTSFDVPKPELNAPSAADQNLPTTGGRNSADEFGDEDVEAGVDGDGDNDDVDGSAGTDPYANLGGAFGGYMADQPQPMAHRRGNNDMDDLLI